MVRLVTGLAADSWKEWRWVVSQGGGHKTIKLTHQLRLFGLSSLRLGFGKWLKSSKHLIARFIYTFTTFNKQAQGG